MCRDELGTPRNLDLLRHRSICLSQNKGSPSGLRRSLLDDVHQRLTALISVDAILYLQTDMMKRGSSTGQSQQPERVS